MLNSCIFGTFLCDTDLTRSWIWKFTCFLEFKGFLFVRLTLLFIFSALNSETVKFGHVTFFWNGNRSGYFNPEMEEYVEIPSDTGITFNVQPKMKALEIAEKARDAILSGKFQQVLYTLPCDLNTYRFELAMCPSDLFFRMLL